MDIKRTDQFHNYTTGPAQREVDYVQAILGAAREKHFSTGGKLSLHELGALLGRAKLFCGVDTVALESTGVYWIPVFEVLEQRGLKVWLVDTRQMKYVPGRKSDVMDCQWLQKLMSLGLLRAAFRPDAQVRVLRAVARQYPDFRSRPEVDAESSCQTQQGYAATVAVEFPPCQSPTNAAVVARESEVSDWPVLLLVLIV